MRAKQDWPYKLTLAPCGTRWIKKGKDKQHEWHLNFSNVLAAFGFGNSGVVRGGVCSPWGGV